MAGDTFFRTGLFRLDEEKHALLIAIHHIIFDEWSFEIFCRELAAYYGAFSQKKPIDLPAPPIQYQDFSVWQRERLEGAVLDQQLAYWRKQLAGAPPNVELMTDRPRTMTQCAEGALVHIHFPKTLSDRLKRLSKQEDSTLFMTLLATFGVLLYRYTRQEDLIIGTPITNRTLPETEDVMGMFLNTLPIRMDLSNNPTFRTFLGQVREVALAAYDHQDLPFEQLIEDLQLERDLNRAPLVQVMFVLQNTTLSALELPGLEVRPAAFGSRSADFDLTLFVADESEGLIGGIHYNPDLFDDTTMKRMVSHFEVLLTHIVSDPDTSVGQLSVLTEQERQQVLIDWNATQTPYPQDRSIHHLFETQVETTPDAVALVFDGAEMTYRTLNQRANQLAYHIGTLGVNPGDFIALGMDRSFEMIIGIMAILKAGCAYVPLDPTYPTERLAFMLEDTQAPLLLTQHTQLTHWTTYEGQVVCLDTDASVINQQPDTDLTYTGCADDSAYIMYTSGSTGQPKGVCVTHQNVVRLVKHTNYAEFNAEQTFLQFAPISFDAATLEIWGALLNGGRLVIFPTQMPSLETLGEVIEQQRITVLWLTAELFHQMIEHHPEKLRGVRDLLAGGDVLSVPHIQKALSCLPNARIINGYGPTENTTFSTYYSMDASTSLGTSVPIGRPIANSQVYILDAYRQPVPIGVVGELYTGGDGVAQGYHNRPELTRTHFIPDSFSDTPNARLYKTGDLARYLPNGDIEFIGRADAQVKIRGFRIELGEIEAVLNMDALVSQCVVVVREDTPGQKHLVAYVVSDDKTSIADRLKQRLQSTLPNYMMPSFFIVLDQFPLTPSGKVDRNALPAPDVEVSLEAYIAPKSPEEKILSEIWCDLLNISRVSIHDNFFNLGGHSLSATQVVSRIKTRFNILLTLRQFFEGPTIIELADKIVKLQTRSQTYEQETRKIAVLSQEELRKNNDHQPIPVRNHSEPALLSFAQERLWFLNSMELLDDLYNVPQIYRLTGSLDLPAFEYSLNEILRRHEILRTTFVSQEGQVVQICNPFKPVDLSLRDLTHLPNEEGRSRGKKPDTKRGEFFV